MKPYASASRQNNSSRKMPIVGWIGVGMIGLGGLLVAFQLLRPTNWWAVFFLLPAMGGLSASTFIARTSRRWSTAAAFIAAPGIVMITVAGLFLISAPWNIYWPLMIASPGVMLILIGLSDIRGLVLRAWFQTLLWTGVMMEILAGVLLAGNMGWVVVEALIPGLAWWGAPMLIPGVAAIYNAVCAARTNGNRAIAGIRFLFALGLSLCAVAAATLGGAPANVQTAVGLMAAGAGMIL